MLSIYSYESSFAKASEDEGGAGGSRTPVQTEYSRAFYMLSFRSGFKIRPSPKTTWSITDSVKSRSTARKYSRPSLKVSICFQVVYQASNPEHKGFLIPRIRQPRRSYTRQLNWLMTICWSHWDALRHGVNHHAPTCLLNCGLPCRFQFSPIFWKNLLNAKLRIPRDRTWIWWDLFLRMLFADHHHVESALHYSWKSY